LDAARKQLEEMRVSSDRRIRQLEAERDQSRSEADRAIASQNDRNLRIRQLEATVDALTASQSSEGGTTLESRIRELETELDAARSRAEQDRQEAGARIARLQSQCEEMEASLAAKDKLLIDSLTQIEEVHEQARRIEEEMVRLRILEAEHDLRSSQLAAREEELLPATNLSARVPVLEADLMEWKNRAAVQTASQPQQEVAPAKSGPDSAALADLYQQTISHLTVIQASAELLAMNSRLDASSRGTAEEIRSASQILFQIIKKFALPPDARRAE
jgi:chromosome segregation ATPase